MPGRTPSIDRPLVTAVIPTRGRPELLACAIRSALRQTWRNLEIVVVLDGPDRESEARIAALAEARIRTVVLGKGSGGAASRNAGVRAARGEWIGFLDDDDEWLPEKIDRQMEAVRQTSVWFPVIASRVIEQGPSGRRVLPQRVYDGEEPVGDYLFCREGFADAGGLLQTSTLLAPRDLLMALPFREDLPMHQDWDWVIRATAHQGVSVLMVPQPLSVYRVSGGGTSVSRNPDWEFSLRWIREQRPWLSPRAVSSFIAVQCAWRARMSPRPVRGFLSVLRAWLSEGRPEAGSLAHLLYFGLFPASLRQRLREQFGEAFGKSRHAGPGLRVVSSRQPAATALRSGNP